MLHLAGAEDTFIARLFLIRFARVAGLAGLIGAGAAAALGVGLRIAGGGEGLTPALPLAWSDLAARDPLPAAGRRRRRRRRASHRHGPDPGHAVRTPS